MTIFGHNDSREMHFILVFLGGGTGCVVRYLIGLLCQRLHPSLPWATFISNVFACLIFTLVLMLTKNSGSAAMRLLLLTGFCGGLSTFSAFGYETYLLFRENLHGAAALNILASCVMCISLFAIFKV
jgi:CrcB protein